MKTPPLSAAKRTEIEARYTGRRAQEWSIVVRRDTASLLAAEAYWRERAERLATAARQAVLDGLACDRMTGGLETLAEEIGINTKVPPS